MRPLRPYIGIDIDGVVANLHVPWIKWLQDFDYEVEEFTHWTHPLDLAGAFALEFLHPRIYNNDIVKPFDGALAAVQIFRDLGYGIRFVSDCINDTANAKCDWLTRWGFLLDLSEFMPMSDKSNAPVYLLVDDHVANVKTFKGLGFLVTRSHNRHELWSGPRLNHLAELYPYIR